MELIEVEKVVINGLEGEFLYFEQDVQDYYVSKYMLSYGNDSNSIMITATFDPDSIHRGEDIKTSMLSAIYDPNKEIVNVKKSFDFEIDINNSKLKYAAMILNMEVYSVDGLSPTESEDKTNFLVTSGMLSFPVNKRRQYVIDNMENAMDSIIVHQENITEIYINDLSGYEITAYGKTENSDKLEFGYLAILFEDDQFYFFFGSASDKFESNHKMFQSIVQSFKKKTLLNEMF